MQTRKRWIFSPTADLWLLPFAALPLPKDPKDLDFVHTETKVYALEAHEISYILSGRDFLHVSADSTPADSPVAPLLIGDPAFEMPTPTTTFRSRLLEADHQLGINDRRSKANLEEDLIPVCFFRNRRLRQSNCAEWPTCIPPEIAPQAKGHLVVRELHSQSNSPETLEVLGLNFGPLPGLKTIMKDLKGTFAAPSSRIWEREKATEANISQLLGSPEYLATVKNGTLSRPKAGYPFVVFATHGFYLAPDGKGDKGKRDQNLLANPNPFMRCGLALAGAKTFLKTKNPGDLISEDIKDNILTGLEITRRLDLNGTQLVLLVACETGKGAKLPSGDSLATVRQAFQLADARLVVATSWEIAVSKNSPTAAIVKTFCESVKDSKELSLAKCEEFLRKAQLSALFESAKPVSRRHPYYWAAFTITGHEERR